MRLLLAILALVAVVLSLAFGGQLFPQRSYPEEPPKRTFSYRSKAIAQAKDNSAQTQSTAVNPTTADAEKKASGAESGTSQHDDDEEINRKLAEYTGELALFTKWLVIATVFLGAVAGIQAIVSYWQWGVLRDTLNETKQSNALTLRAWLLVEHIETPDLSAEGVANKKVLVTVRNFGKLPATDVTKHEGFEVSKIISGSQQLLPDFELTGWRTIGAGQSFTFRLHLEEIPDVMAEIAAAGSGVLMLRVRFKYRDAIKTNGDTSHAAFYSSTPDPHFVEWPRDSKVS